MEYSPEAYLECCEEHGDTPTQEGFLEYIEEWINEDFQDGNGTQEIQEIDQVAVEFS